MGIVASVFDVAAYILQRQGEMTAMKLQKLCYYSQAWHLVWEERPLFPERIEAWANGPVVQKLYAALRGKFRVAKLPATEAAKVSPLTPGGQATVDAVLEYYGPLTAHQLSELTHVEQPWVDARKGLSPGERGNHAITEAAMATYYDSLTAASAQA